jgi:signal transduction histidine kinase
LSRPSGLTLLTCVLLVLLPAVALLQYRWVGEVSAAERERMGANLRNATQQFRDAFDLEVGRAFLNLQVGPLTARDGWSDQYSDRYDAWMDTAEHPRMVSAIMVVDAPDRTLRLRRWNADSHTFVDEPWPAAPSAIASLRGPLERELAEFGEPRPFERRQWTTDDSLLIAPMRNLVGGPGPNRGQPQSVTPVFGYTVVQLDMRYIADTVFPALVQRHFTHADGTSYRVAIESADEPARVIYQSDATAPVTEATADAVEPLFGSPFGRGPSRGGPRLFVRGGGPRFDGIGEARPEGRGEGRGGNRGDARNDGRADGRSDVGNDAARMPPPAQATAQAGEPGDGRGGRGGRAGRGDGPARWRVLVQHESGSLETAVAAARRRNLAISFGVLLVLTVSVGLLTLTSRRSRRLARQQMEFVAGVSHELRTPVAVIRSAAENLSLGVVAGDRVKRYGDVIGSESRRLGEMVESILQYAAFESGHGIGAQVPVSPGDIIEAAVSSASAMDTASDATIERDVPSDLPAITGDATALRSAVQNLVANAIKYGGSDRWVGVTARVEPNRRGQDVIITVSDHGAGIPAAELPLIFEPFYRGSDALTQQIHGNGLGLSLVRRIVTAHGGRVSVTAKPGQTTFTIALPVAPPEAQTRTFASDASAAPLHS